MIRQERLDELKRYDDPHKFFDEFSCEANIIVKQHREDFEDKAHSFAEKRLKYVAAVENLLKERKEREKPPQPFVFEQYRKQLSGAKIPERLSILEQCQKQLSNINNPAVVFCEIGIIEQCLKWLLDVRESIDISRDVEILVQCKEQLWDIIEKQGWKNATIGLSSQTRRRGIRRSYTHNIWVPPDFPDDPALWFEIYDPIKYDHTYRFLTGVAVCSPEDELLRGYVALAILFNKQAIIRGESPIALDILCIGNGKGQLGVFSYLDKGQLFGIEIPQERFFNANDSNWLKVRNVLISDLIAVDKDLANREQNESQPVKNTGTQTDLNQHQEDMSGDNLQPNKVFLSHIAGDVDELVRDCAFLQTFQERIRPFAQRWEQHNKDTEIAEAKRKKHWQKVKSNPAWQDKKAGSPKKGWEWDRFYLGDLGIDAGPTYEMPAKYAPAVMAKLEGYIEANKQKLHSYNPTTTEYQRLEETVVKQEQNLADIRTQFDKLPKKNEGWISTAVPFNRPVQGTWIQFLWFRYTDLSDEEVFGCWRPQLKQIEPNPLYALIPEKETGKLPPPVNREQEYERYYVILTSIHDNMLTGVQSISDSIWPKELAEDVWFRLTDGQPYGPDKGFIEAALERIQDKIANTPNQTQQLETLPKKDEKPKLQPLTKKARLIYDKLYALKPQEAMTLPEIQDWLWKEHNLDLDEGTWSKKIRQELILYGLKNRRKVGYYIEKK